tara:strand:- start:25262 stop:25435 length:174 start_codon:yes stop_codon:yes gene_type:complete
MSNDTTRISNQLFKALERLELATEILKMWVEYMDSDLSEAEKILVARSNRFLGKDKE